MIGPASGALVASKASSRPTFSVQPATDDSHPFLVVSWGGTSLIVGEATKWTVIDLPRPPTEEDHHHLLAHGIPPWVVGRPATKAEIVAALKDAIEHQRKVANGNPEQLRA
jgi:hypothetical protein